MPEAIQGANGSRSCFSACCVIARFGLDEYEAWESLLWFNANKCLPPFPEDELKRKLKDAYHRIQRCGEFGCFSSDTHKHKFEPFVNLPVRNEPLRKLQPYPRLDVGSYGEILELQNLRDLPKPCGHW